MEYKITVLLRSLLKHGQGLYGFLKEEIDIALDLYCEISNVSKEELIDQINHYRDIVYKRVWMDNDCQAPMNLFNSYMDLLIKDDNKPILYANNEPFEW